MPEVVAILAIFVVLPSVIVGGIIKVKQAKYEAMERGGGGELRASELQRIIREAVEDAVEPLYERIEALEGRAASETPSEIERPVAESRLDPAALADALDDPEAEDEPAAARRRTRQ